MGNSNEVQNPTNVGNVVLADVIERYNFPREVGFFTSKEIESTDYIEKNWIITAEESQLFDDSEILLVAYVNVRYGKNMDKIEHSKCYEIPIRVIKDVYFFIENFRNCCMGFI